VPVRRTLDVHADISLLLRALTVITRAPAHSNIKAELVLHCTSAMHRTRECKAPLPMRGT
jgi:hypothetical protein